MSLAPKPALAPKRSTPNIRSLQAAFEGQQPEHINKHPHAIYPPNGGHRSNAGDLVPSANKSSARNPSLAKSIDAILDTPAAPRPASPPNRPLAKFRPSWIGPQPSKPMKAEISGHLEAAMKQRVSIEFASPGLQPPVYIFTSLSDPQWTAIEMFPVKQMNGDFTFVRNFDVEEGEYQYKFRLGPGDWWVCDEKREIVDDGGGNRNNRVVVTAAEKQAVDSGHASPEREMAAAIKAISGLMPKAATTAEPVITPPSDQKPRAIDAGKAHESASTPVSMRETSAPIVRDASVQATSKSAAPKMNDAAQETVDFESEAEPYTAPLLRHESLSPTSHEQDHSPLFRHESIGLGHHPGDAAPHSSNASPGISTAPAATIAPLASQGPGGKEAALLPFPTDHQGILEHIQRTHTRLPEDETVAGIMKSSPASSAAISDSSSLSGVPPLPSVDEEDDEEEDQELGRIREAGEQEAEQEQENGEELDPLQEGELAAPGEAEDADFEPKIPELKVLIVPQVEDPAREVMRADRRASMAEKYGTRNLMAVAVGLLAVIAAAAVVKLFR